MDENGNCLKENQPGEIVISAQSVMKGYWKNPDETGKKLKFSMYYSGDLGYLDNEGYLFILSRRTDLIISGGENINPLEVEEAILKYPGTKEVCVFPLKDKKWGQIAAAAVISSDKDLDSEKLKLFLREKLSPFKIPKKIFPTDELPRTSLGKIKREELRLRYETKEIAGNSE
jgi:acyl-CoA synthetase (AMP-forming)/AMP-acid ligase II